MSSHYIASSGLRVSPVKSKAGSATATTLGSSALLAARRRVALPHVAPGCEQMTSGREVTVAEM